MVVSKPVRRSSTPNIASVLILRYGKVTSRKNLLPGQICHTKLILSSLPHPTYETLATRCLVLLRGIFGSGHYINLSKAPVAS